MVDGMKFTEIVSRSIKLLYISKKPKNSEFKKIAKIAGIGAIIIGLTGMVMSVIASYI